MNASTAGSEDRVAVEISEAVPPRDSSEGSLREQELASRLNTAEEILQIYSERVKNLEQQLSVIQSEQKADWSKLRQVYAQHEEERAQTAKEMSRAHELAASLVVALYLQHLHTPKVVIETVVDTSTQEEMRALKEVLRMTRRTASVRKNKIDSLQATIKEERQAEARIKRAIAKMRTELLAQIEKETGNHDSLIAALRDRDATIAELKRKLDT